MGANETIEYLFKKWYNNKFYRVGLPLYLELPIAYKQKLLSSPTFNRYVVRWHLSVYCRQIIKPFKTLNKLIKQRT